MDEIINTAILKLREAKGQSPDKARETVLEALLGLEKVYEGAGAHRVLLSRIDSFTALLFQSVDPLLGVVSEKALVAAHSLQDYKDSFMSSLEKPSLIRKQLDTILLGLEESVQQVLYSDLESSANAWRHYHKQVFTLRAFFARLLRNNSLPG